MDIKDKITKFYEENIDLLSEKRKTLDGETVLENINDIIFINSCPGVGDVLSVFHLPKLFKKHGLNSKVHSANTNLFNGMAKYNPDIKTVDLSWPVFKVEQIQAWYDFGGGHWFQNVQKSLGLEMDVKPKPDLRVPGVEKQKDKVVLNFHAGADQARQKQEVHPRARELYPEHRDTIQKFINNNKDKYHFVEVSQLCSNFENVEDKCGTEIDKSIEEIASCEYYLGIINGIMHVATALDLKCITIVNFPSAKQIYLPRLKNFNLPEIDTFYPQNVHLHEDDDGDLVKYLSYDNLEKAFNGEIYPFWEEDYIHLFFEQCQNNSL